MNIVKGVFRPGLEALLNRQPTARERERRIEEIRAALSGVLQSSSAGPGGAVPTVAVIGARAVIAAGFEAVLEDIEEKGLVAPGDDLR